VDPLWRNGRASAVTAPRWFDRRTNARLAIDSGGPLARFWVTALAGLVDRGYVKATGAGRPPPSERRQQWPGYEARQRGTAPYYTPRSD